jgi:hypothetical protein
LSSTNFTFLIQLGLAPPRGIRRQDAVVVAVDDHGGDVVAGNILAEVLDPGEPEP